MQLPEDTTPVLLGLDSFVDSEQMRMDCSFLKIICCRGSSLPSACLTSRVIIFSARPVKSLLHIFQPRVNWAQQHFLLFLLNSAQLKYNLRLT